MSTDDTRWMVLLDAAAFVPTQPLNLSAVPADFVSVSFYKVRRDRGLFVFHVVAAGVLIHPPMRATRCSGFPRDWVP